METGFMPLTVNSFLKQDLCEYLLVVHTDAIVKNKINSEKQSFGEKYGVKISDKNKPHITIAGFFAREAMEETIIRWMQRILCSTQSFSVSLNNFSGFPPDTIYLRVQNPAPFQLLAGDLQVIDTYVRSNDCPPACFIKTPHLAIASKLTEALYQQAVMDYSQRTFHETFVADELVLLRKCYRQDADKTINIFRLPPQVNVYN